MTLPATFALKSPENRNRFIQAALFKYEEKLIRHASAILGDIERARDVVQDTFLQLWKADLSKVQGYLPQWLYTVCKNKALDIKRKDKRLSYLASENSPEPVSTASAPSELMELNEQRHEVVALLHSTLSPRELELVRLKFEEDFSYQQMADQTGLTVSNVGFILHRAIKKVQGKLQRLEQKQAHAG